MDLAKPKSPPPLNIFMVTSPYSPEFSHFQSALRHSSIIALDAEWKPVRSRQIADSSEDYVGEPTFPTVTLLQIACRVSHGVSDAEVYSVGNSPVFLVDLLSIPLSAIWELLRDMFVSPSVLKLGFRFKQDLVNLSFTFASQGFPSGFDRIEPFIDITSMYYHMKHQNGGKKFPKDTISLATICWEILSISLSKELQCSDWSSRPLTEGQISYAAADAYYLLEVFAVFEQEFLTKETGLYKLTELSSPRTGGLKELFTDFNACKNVVRTKYCSASDMMRACHPIINFLGNAAMGSSSQPVCEASYILDKHILDIAKLYGENIVLKEADRKPRLSRRKRVRQLSGNTKSIEQFGINNNWQGCLPWDPAFGGDGCSKFLCDVMVEGLARHLRCVGIDAAISSFKKPDPRQLLDQTYKEKRVLLTRDAKLLKHQYLASNQVYMVKSLLKNDQLLEVIETFHLNISEQQLMSRCTKCNGSFIQKPLTYEEAIEASKGFQIIPNCLFDKDTEFWQCTDCRQLYWEGTQYHNAVEKFVNICKLST